MNSKRIIEYAVTYGEDADELTKQVNALIECGWQPFGAVVFANETSQTPPVLLQAMVKYEEGTL